VLNPSFGTQDFYASVLGKVPWLQKTSAFATVKLMYHTNQKPSPIAIQFCLFSRVAMR